MKLQCICAVLFCISSISAAATEIHKWTDEDGRVHYGDAPPGSTSIGKKQDKEQTEAIKQQQEKDLERLRKLQQGYNQRRSEKEEAEEKARIKAREKKKRCQYARQRLAQYKRSNVLVRINAKGKREYLDEKQRMKLLRNAGKQVRKHCR